MSNYYVKGHTEAGRPFTVTIEDDNIFTRCPVCGREHHADILELSRDGGFDLYGTAVFCRECSENHRSKRKGSIKLFPSIQNGE